MELKYFGKKLEDKGKNEFEHKLSFNVPIAAQYTGSHKIDDIYYFNGETVITLDDDENVKIEQDNGTTRVIISKLNN
jgi:hypothetical protein